MTLNDFQYNFYTWEHLPVQLDTHNMDGQDLQHRILRSVTISDQSQQAMVLEVKPTGDGICESLNSMQKLVSLCLGVDLELN